MSTYGYRRVITAISCTAMIIALAAGVALAQPSGNQYACTGMGFNLCTVYNREAGVLQAQTSGGFTNYHTGGGGPELEQAGTTLCLTYNANLGAFDEITCASKVSQRFTYIFEGSAELIKNNYNGKCMADAGGVNGGAVSTVTCNSSDDNDLWFWS